MTSTTPDERCEPELSVVDAAQLLRAMAADDDPSDGGAALTWREARKLIPTVVNAVESVLAESVC